MTTSHKPKRVETREWVRLRSYLTQMRGLFEARDMLKDDPAELAIINRRIDEFITESCPNCVPPRYEDER